MLPFFCRKFSEWFLETYTVKFLVVLFCDWLWSRYYTTNNNMFNFITYLNFLYYIHIVSVKIVNLDISVSAISSPCKITVLNGFKSSFSTFFLWDVVVPPLFVFTVTLSFNVLVLMSLVIELLMMSTFLVFLWLFLSLNWFFRLGCSTVLFLDTGKRIGWTYWCCVRFLIGLRW
jgi:hypothetical protein